MIEETRYQMMMLILFGAFVLVWLQNLLSAGLSRNVLYTREEGLGIGISLRLMLAASIVGIVIYIHSPALMKWSSLALPAWIRDAGILIGILGLVLFGWILHTLGKNFSTSIGVKKAQTLVTSGPYQWVRHPMYTVFIVIWISFFLISCNWFIALTGFAAYGITVVLRTPREEKMLVERFG